MHKNIRRDMGLKSSHVSVCSYGSVVEFSPATREDRVRILEGFLIFFLDFLKCLLFGWYNYNFNEQTDKNTFKFSLNPYNPLGYRNHWIKTSLVWWNVTPQCKIYKVMILLGDSILHRSSCLFKLFSCLIIHANNSQTVIASQTTAHTMSEIIWIHW